MGFSHNRNALGAVHHFLCALLLCASSIQLCLALYEDQIGKFDWRQQYIGRVDFAYVDPSITGIQKFHVATDENVLACLSTRTGSIIWRQIFEKGEEGRIDAVSEDGSDLVTINGNGRFIRSWDPNTGVLLWETAFPNTNHKDASIFHVNSEDKEITRVEIKPKEHVKISVYSFTRASMKTSELIRGSFVDVGNCEFISSQFFMCLDKSSGTLNLLPIKDNGSFISAPLKNFGIELNKKMEMRIIQLPHQKTSSKPYFIVQLDKEFVLFQIEPPGISLKKILPNVHMVTTAVVDKKLLLFTLVPMNDAFRVIVYDTDSFSEVKPLEGSVKIFSEHGKIENIFILPYTKKDMETSYKLLFSMEDHAVLFIHQQSRLIWSREEALSKIVSAEILDLPLSETDANIEQEFGDSDASIITMLYMRLKSQIYLLETFLHQYFIELQQNRKISGGPIEPGLSRDTFGLHKIIVVVTEPGKIFGIDNMSGQIVWSHVEKGLAPFVTDDQMHYPVFVQRTTAHFPYAPQCTILGKHKISGNTYLYSFNPINGATVDSLKLPYKVLQASVMYFTDNHYLRGIILLDHDHKIYTYPKSTYSVLSEHKNTHFMLSANTSSGILAGLTIVNSDDIDDSNFEAKVIWKVQLPNKITKVALKRPFEHVHSQGRVMGDRSVLYKYLNPNLAAVFTEGYDVTQKSFCNIYLVDTVTGHIVYSASHKKCRHPVKVVHSENWIVYSYYNEKSRRIEISSIELFEGVSQSNTTAFSSFSPPPQPLVEHQSFIFPSPIEAMADTVTERGLTNKHILIALPTGGIFELPKIFLDPRRPVTLTPEHREEGLMPYIPELPIISDRIINYNQSVMSIRNIQTAPSSLESTCLVFAYGLDLFYTRVTPSKTFDILKDDFDHYLISVVLLALLLLSYTAKKLAARKSLKAAWK